MPTVASLKDSRLKTCPLIPVHPSSKSHRCSEPLVTEFEAVQRLFRQPGKPGLEVDFSPILPDLVRNQTRYTYHHNVDDSINIGIQQNLKKQPAQPSRIGEVL